MSSRTAPPPLARAFPFAPASLGLAMVSGLLLRLWLATRNAGITMDSPLYVRMSEAITHGHRLIGPAHHGYPALIALARLPLQDPILAGRAVSLVAGMALLPLVYWLGRRTLAPAWATLPVWLVALRPLIAVYGGVTMTESLVLALVYGALLLVERGRFAAGGAVMGAAYLVRPEALALAPLAALFSRSRRGALLALAAFALVLVPYAGYLRWEHGSWMISPKTVLVRPAAEDRQALEWRVGDTLRAGAEPRGFVERVRWAAPSVASHYLPGLARHLRSLLRSWPWPLVLLSALGLAAWRRALLAPVLMVAALPLLAVPPDPRFSLLALPALAVFAGCGGAWAAARMKQHAPRVAAAAAAVAALGTLWVWAGPEGRTAREFDDGPMAQMREAGDWLRAHGRPGARVMDRKVYVPFFAGMEHIQLPDDDYDTIVEFARRSGVDYIVLEEYIVRSIRRQMLPLAIDPEFAKREKRLRLVHVGGGGPLTGVAVLEVVRDPTGAGPP